MLKQCLAVCGLLSSSFSFAADIQLMGTETFAVSVSPTRTLNASMMPHSKKISLLAIKLSDTAQDNLVSREQSMHSNLDSPFNLPRSKQLGMAGVPVLDQGAHGACVTFASTAAVDAAIYKSDAISQLCQLELGSYLEKVSNNPSGWDGSFGHIVLSQMDTFGMVSKAKQLNSGCGGLTAYPGFSPDAPDNMLSPEEFRQLLDGTTTAKLIWFPILHVNEALSIPVDAQRVLSKVKEAINGGDRIVFGSLLVDPDEGVAGALGKYHQTNDAWVLTPHLKYDMEHTLNFAGHEMVITGYDDDAVAIDADKGIHTGLLTLRNSWGTNVGDQGNFYMSYDYFKALVIEAHQIRTM